MGKFLRYLFSFVDSISIKNSSLGNGIVMPAKMTLKKLLMLIELKRLLIKSLRHIKVNSLYEQIPII